jgi:hypothetical protein
LTCGIDWAREDHAEGLRGLIRRLSKIGVTEVAIERPDGPVVDALLTAALTVVMISPNQLKNLRSRYGSAGNKDDRFDAYVLADTLRTDRHRLRPLTPDSPDTVTLRQLCRSRKDLVGHRVALQCREVRRLGARSRSFDGVSRGEKTGPLVVRGNP